MHDYEWWEELKLLGRLTISEKPFGGARGFQAEFGTYPKTGSDRWRGKRLCDLPPIHNWDLGILRITYIPLAVRVVCSLPYYEYTRTYGYRELRIGPFEFTLRVPHLHLSCFVTIPKGQIEDELEEEHQQFLKDNGWQ